MAARAAVAESGVAEIELRRMRRIWRAARVFGRGQSHTPRRGYWRAEGPILESPRKQTRSPIKSPYYCDAEGSEIRRRYNVASAEDAGQLEHRRGALALEQAYSGGRGLEGSRAEFPQLRTTRFPRLGTTRFPEFRTT